MQASPYVSAMIYPLFVPVPPSHLFLNFGMSPSPSRFQLHPPRRAHRILRRRQRHRSRLRQTRDPRWHLSPGAPRSTLSSFYFLEGKGGPLLVVGTEFAPPCTSSPCLNNGTCNGAGLDFNCTCPDNFNGTVCQIRPAEPSPRLCCHVPKWACRDLSVHTSGENQLHWRALVHLSGICERVPGRVQQCRQLHWLHIHNLPRPLLVCRMAWIATSSHLT